MNTTTSPTTTSRDETDEPDVAGRRGPDAAEYIRTLIVTGKLRAGDRVRAEQIASELDVSATPVREALHSLQAHGFLTYERNRGFVVTRLSADDIRDVYISIGLLVGELAARIAKTADESDLAPLRAIQERLHDPAAAADPAGATELVADFYRHLHRLGRSPKIVGMVLTLDMYTTRELYAGIPGWLAPVVQFQDLLVAALAARQPEVARAAVRGHMEESAKIFSRLFETAPGGEPADEAP